MEQINKDGTRRELTNFNVQMIAQSEPAYSLVPGRRFTEQVRQSFWFILLSACSFQ